MKNARNGKAEVEREIKQTTIMSTRINPYPNRQGQTAGPSDGSRTITIHDVPTGEQGGSDKGSGRDEEGENSQIGVLRLRGGGNTRRVVWSSETIDNEGMGKKKSKSENVKEMKISLTEADFLISLLHLPQAKSI